MLNNKSSTDFRYWAGWANPQLPRKLLGATSRPLRSLLAASPQPSQPPQNFLAMSHRPFVFAFLKYMRAFASPPLATRYTTLPRVNGKPPFGGFPTPHDVVSVRTPLPRRQKRIPCNAPLLLRLLLLPLPKLGLQLLLPLPLQLFLRHMPAVGSPLSCRLVFARTRFGIPIDA